MDQDVRIELDRLSRKVAAIQQMLADQQGPVRMDAKFLCECGASVTGLHVHQTSTNAPFTDITYSSPKAFTVDVTK